jgi:alcohol dehydrogenase class IV
VIHMFPFEFNLKTKIICQLNAIQFLGEELTQLNISKLLIVTDVGVVKAGVTDRIFDELRTSEIDYKIYDQVKPNPTISIIEKGYREYLEADCNGILAIGGGSSIDSAKGIAILVTNGGTIADYFGAFKVKSTPAPLIAIPTTAGTGSEVSTQVSVKDDITHAKYAIRSYMAQPAVALLDPSLLATLPSKIAAETGMDTLTHLIEGYVSKGANPLTDALALYGIELVGTYLQEFVSNPTNTEAATNMLTAAMIGGIVLSHARTGAAHTITRPMGDGITHGLANAILLPYVMEFNLETNVKKFSQIAKALGEHIEGDINESAKKSIEYVRNLNSILGIPSSLGEVGIKKEQIISLSEKAYELDISRLNPRELGAKDIEQILAKAI